MPRPALPTRFRTRLTAAFIFVASVTSGALALGSYLIVSEYRHHVFEEHAHQAAELALLSAPQRISLEDFDTLLHEYQRRAGFESLAVVGDVTFSSSPQLRPEDIPERLRSDLPSGSIRHANATVAGERFFVAGGAPQASDVRLYFFFSKADLLESLSTFRNVLSLGWVVAVAAAAGFGHLVSRRTLRPVREAAGAAQALAEGLLETRLQPESDDEFGAWSLSFNQMAEALEHKIAELSQAAERERRFTANVAHDLRTPLTGMSSAVSLLEEELSALPPSAVRVTELLIADVRRLETLVLELLELARIDAGQDVPNLEVLSVGDSIRAIVRSWDGQSPPVSIHEGEELWILADRPRFKSVVSNLLTNAHHHGGGEIEVAIRAEGDVVAVDVLDRGRGLTEHELEHVFDRFYKGDPSRTGGGSGLGLAIAWENARLQGGSLQAANREGGGARFTLRLRRAEEET